MSRIAGMLALSLMGALLAGSAITWVRLAERWNAGRPALPYMPREPVAWHRAVLSVAFLWIAWSLLNRLVAAFTPVPEEPAAHTPESLLQGIAANAALMTAILGVLVVALIAQSPRKSLADYGVTMTDFGRQALIACEGLLATVVPFVTVMVLMIPFRTLETQHPLLKVLREYPSWQFVSAVFVMAVVLAPLLEELLFRVIVQGWLVTRIPERPAIIGTALLFAGVHGWRDGIPLIPLALVLGYIYHRTHRYFAVVLLHAMFNGVMQLLALLFELASRD